MSHSISLIADHTILLVIFSICIVVGVIFYFFIGEKFLQSLTIKWVLPTVLILFTLEYFVLGENSFISFDGEGNLAVAVNHHLTYGEKIGTFSHSMVGGIDLAILFPGQQYIQPEVYLVNWLPTWLIIWFHKLGIALLGFLGTFLLVRRLSADHVVAPLVCATAYPLSHDYLLNYSTEFGTGYAVIPLAVYIAVCTTENHRFWWKVFGVGILVALAQPMKVFPALLPAFIAGLIVTENLKSYRSYIAFVIFILISLLNWHEILFALIKVAPYTWRGYDAGSDDKNMIVSLINGQLLYISVWFSLLIFVGSILCIFYYKPKINLLRIISAILSTFVIFVFADSFEWQKIGLDLLNRISHQYSRLALPTVAVMVFAIMVSDRTTKSLRVSNSVPIRSLLVLSIFTLLWVKSINFSQWVLFGGQNQFFGYENLHKPVWAPQKNFRVVTLFDAPHPNITSAFYGFDSFDGGSNLNPKNYADYWIAVMKNDRNYIRASRTRIEWENWNGATYNVDGHFRTDLLAAANVKFIFSALPLTGLGMKMIYAPKKRKIKGTKVRLRHFDSIGSFLRFRVGQIFDSGELYVYELKNVLPRVYSVDSITVLPKNITTKTFYDTIAKAAKRLTVVVRKQDLPPNTPSMDVKLNISSYQKTVDGFLIFLKPSKKNGLMVVNNSFLPFWTASTKKDTLTIFPVNGVQMAIKVPADTEYIELKYKRPTVKGNIKSWLQKY